MKSRFMPPEDSLNHGPASSRWRAGEWSEWLSWGSTLCLMSGSLCGTVPLVLGAEPIQLARTATRYEENASRAASDEPPLLTPSLVGKAPSFDTQVIDSAPQRETPATPIRVSAVTVSELRRESRSSFERGLLPLINHLEHLALAERAAVVLIPRQRGTEPWPAVESAALLRALEPRLQDLRNCVRGLERFAQPASAGYEADLILARWALLDAQVQSAWMTGKSQQVPQLLAAQQVQARRLYGQRLFDYHVLGTASLPEVSQAIAMLNLAPRYHLAARRETVQITDRWHAVGAGIGSSSALLNAELEYLGLQASIGRQHEDVSLMARALEDSEIQSRTLFQTQRSNWAKGTASLSDLARGWQYRWELHHSADRMGVSFSIEADKQLDRDLKLLGHAARGQRDLRGSMPAQVLHVGLLQELRATELDPGS